MIEKTLAFRETFGDYQRQLFLMDHAGLPLKTVLEQLDLLGEEVVPVLRKELDDKRPAHVPDAPNHASLVAAAAAKAAGTTGSPSRSVPVPPSGATAPLTTRPLQSFPRPLQSLTRPFQSLPRPV